MKIQDSSCSFLHEERVAGKMKVRTHEGSMKNRKIFLPFSVPGIDENDIQAVMNVLRSGWITTGKECAAFEAQIAEYVGAPYACALTSATAGWHCVAMALGIKPGDEVIMPSMTWVSDANVVELLGATPVFVDVDLETLMVTPERIANAISPRTKAILPVHYAGAPVDLDPIRELAARYRVAVIEDAAHAIGTAYKGRKIGAEGTAIFSLHPIKNITTAEGGIVTTHDSDLFNVIKRLKFHGLGKDAWDRYSKKGAVAVAEVVQPGLKYNLPDLLAALGVSQLRKLDAFNARRTELAGRYHKLLKTVDGIRCLSAPEYDHTHTHHLFIIMVDRADMTRDEFVQGLKDRNIGSGIHFKACHTHTYYRATGRYSDELLPNTTWASDRLLSLPLFPGMTEQDQDDVVAAIKDILGA